MAYSASILHLSDLHFGEKNRFMKKNIEPEKLGNMSAMSVLEACRNDHLSKIDLVIVTGDIAERALLEEYDYALKFFNTLKHELQLATERFVFIPGNHDVSWGACEKSREKIKNNKGSTQLIEEELQKVKFSTFCLEFVEKFYGKKWHEIPACLPNDAHVYDFDDLHLSIAALNTCEKEDNLKQIGCFGEKQAQAVMDHWRNEDFKRYIKIMAVHHNPNAVPEEVVNSEVDMLPKGNVKLTGGELQKKYLDLSGFEGKERIEEIIRQREVHLLLYGHQHMPSRPSSIKWDRHIGECHVFTVGSFGLMGQEMAGEDTPNCIAVHSFISTHDEQTQVRSLSLEYDPKCTLPNLIAPGCFRKREREPLFRNLYFNFKEIAPSGTIANRDTGIVRDAQIGIGNILADNERLKGKLASSLKISNNAEVMARALCSIGFEEAWYKINELLRLNEVKLDEVKSLLFWLAATEAEQELVGLLRSNAKLNHTVNTRYPIMVEIIIAAAFNRPISMVTRNVAEKGSRKVLMVGDDLLCEVETGLLIMKNREDVIRMLNKKFDLQAESPKGMENLEKRLGTLYKSGTPCYVITDSVGNTINISNLLEFRLSFSETAAAPVVTDEMVVMQILEIILTKLLKENR